jgi:pimeloyl-ACP methyl ester carboxylesterase
MCADMGLETFERQMHALLDRPEVESLMPSITCPTLVCTGAQDEWANAAQHQAIAEAINGAHLVVVPEAGHMLPVERAEAMTQALVSWLDMSYADDREVS